MARRNSRNCPICSVSARPPRAASPTCVGRMAVRIFKLADRAEQIAAELDEILDIPPVHPATPPS